MVFVRDTRLEGDLCRILRIIFSQTEAARNTQDDGDGRLLDAEVLGFKILQHSMSAYVLYRGTEVPELSLKGPYRDLFSILGLARMCHESFLYFHHIFAPELSEEEREFRYLAWVYVDARRQASFPIQTEDLLRQKAERESQANELQERLQNSARFKQLTVKEQGNIIRRLRWPLASIADLAREAGFNSLHSGAIYNYLSSYAHPGNLGVRQARFGAPMDMMGPLATTGLKHVAIICACLAQDYARVFPTAGIVLEVDTPGGELVDLYAGLARKEY